MLRVYVDTTKWTSTSHFFGKELVPNTEPAWPGTHHVDFELAQFVNSAPFKTDVLHKIGKSPGVIAGSITARRSEVDFPGMAKKSEYPMQINEDALIVQDDRDTLTFWGKSLGMVRNAFMAAIGEHYVKPNNIAWAEFEKSSTKKDK
jgi:hypothetical protein